MLISSHQKAPILFNFSLQKSLLYEKVSKIHKTTYFFLSNYKKMCLFGQNTLNFQILLGFPMSIKEYLTNSKMVLPWRYLFESYSWSKSVRATIPLPPEMGDTISISHQYFCLRYQVLISMNLMSRYYYCIGIVEAQATIIVSVSVKL